MAVRRQETRPHRTNPLDSHGTLAAVSRARKGSHIPQGLREFRPVEAM